MKVLGVAELTLLLIYLLRQHKKYGYFVFLNIRKLAFSFWLGAFGLYNLGISSLLQPDIPINILGFLIICRDGRYEDKDREPNGSCG